MTQSVDQTAIKDVTPRQHHDPPGLWIAVVTSSVALHLLLFWLMRYNNPFSLWFPRDSQAPIPIEIIEISPSSSKAKPPKPQLKAKTASPPSANQQSSTVTPKNENSGKINFGAIRKHRERNTFVSKSNTQVVPKQSVSTPKPIFTATPTPTQIPTDSLGNLPWKRSINEDSQIPSRKTPRQAVAEDSQIPSRRTPRQAVDEDSQIPSRRTPRQPVAEDSQIPSRKTPRQPVAEDSQIPSRRTPRQPVAEDSQIPTSRKTPQPSTGGGLITISRVTLEEQRSLMRNPPPEGLILPEYVGNKEKQINSISLNPNLDLLEKEFLVSLVIDKAGNFVQAVVEDPAIAPQERGKYQQFANSIFQGDKFQPARSTNNTPVPELVNRFVRIKIQRR